MIPLIQENLTAVLQGSRSADDARFILRVQENGPDLEREFDRIFSKLSTKLPGLALPYEKLLEDDPIESDPLIAQGNLAILRLDAVYSQAFEAWKNSGGILTFVKNYTTPENPATYSPRTDKRERSEKTYPPDAQLLSEITTTVLSAFRIQATITHRREKLTGVDASPEPDPRTKTAKSKPESLAEKCIDADKDDLIDPIPLIQGVSKLGPLTGVNTNLSPFELIGPEMKSPQTSKRAATRSKPKSRANDEDNARNSIPFQEHSETPEIEAHSVQTTNHRTRVEAGEQESQEEPLVTAPDAVELAATYQQTHFTHNQPALVQRE